MSATIYRDRRGVRRGRPTARGRDPRPRSGALSILAVSAAAVALLVYLVAHNYPQWAILVALLPIPLAWIMRRRGNAFLLAVTVMLVVPYWYAHVWLLPPIIVMVGLLRGTARPRLQWVDIAFALVVALFVASWLFHSDLHIPVKRFIEAMLPFGFYVWARLNVDAETLPRLQWTMLHAGAFAACTVLYEAVRGVAVFVDPAIYQWAGSDSTIFRAGGIFGGSPTAAIVLAMVLLSTLPLYRANPRYTRVLFGIIVAAILVTLDRAGVLGLIVGAVLVAALLPYRRWTRVAWLALAVVVAVYAVTGSSALMSRISNSRVVTQGIVRSSTISERQSLLADALPLIADSRSHLLFGRGFDSLVQPGSIDSNLAVRPGLWVTANGPNDDYLRALLEQGLVGLLAILGWLVGSLLTAIRGALSNPRGSHTRFVLIALGAATLAFMVAALGHDMAHNIAALSAVSLVTGTLVSVRRLGTVTTPEWSGLPWLRGRLPTVWLRTPMRPTSHNARAALHARSAAPRFQPWPATANFPRPMPLQFQSPAVALPPPPGTLGVPTLADEVATTPLKAPEGPVAQRPAARARPGSLRATFLRLAPSSAVVQLVSFGSSVVLAMTLGASTGTDAFYLAISVPLLAYTILNSAARVGAIPGLTRLAHTRSQREVENAAQELVRAWFSAACVLTLLLTAAMFVILPSIAGGSAGLSALTKEYVLELAPYAVTGAVLGSLGAVLAVRGRFAITTLVLLFEPLCKAVLVLLFHRHFGAQTLVVGSLVGNFLAVAILWYAVRRSGVVIRLKLTKPSPWVRSVLMFSAPLVVSQSILQFNPVIDRVAAAGLGSGNVTVLQFGLKVFTAPTMIITSILIAPLTATWSARLASEGWQAVVTSFQRVVSGILLVTPPLVVLGFITRRELVEVAYQSHHYGVHAVIATANVMGMLMLGFIPQVLIPPLASLFVIRGDTMFPLKVGITNAVLNASLDYALRGPFGVAGIALSTSVTLAILCGVYIWKAQTRWGSLGMRQAARTVLISVPASTAIALLCVGGLGLPWSASGRFTALAAVSAAAGIGVVIYAIAMRLGRSTVAAALPGSWLPRFASPGILVGALRRR